MAVDSKAKRSSALNFGWGDDTLPESDGSVAQADRQQLLGMYGGILASAAVVVGGLEFTIPVNRQHFTLHDNRMHFVTPEQN